MANTYLTKSAFGSANQKTYTISFWTKLAVSATGNVLAFVAGGNYVRLFFENGALKIKSVINSSTVFEVKTNRLFRDFSSWYHFVIAMDTTQATDSNRIKFYVNGVQETSLAQSTYPSQNFDTDSNNDLKIGYNGTDNYFDGSMTHFHYTDGYAYDADDFGSSDSVSGIWKPKTAPSVTYGSGGFFLKFENSGAMGTDSSGNSNTFAVGGGTLTQSPDTPSNNFATFNPLIGNHGATFGNGNTFVYRNSSGADRRIACTLGATSGKYYAEFQLGTEQWGGVSLTNGGDIARTEAGSNGYMGEYADDKSVGVRQDGLVYSHGANVTSSQWNQGSLGATDKLCLALDLDNKKLFLGKNGTWSSSSNPATNTGGITLTGDSYTFCGATDNADCKINTGNGYFGTDAISSAGTAPSEGGIFEYDCPSGYQALCTKGINSF